MATVATRQGEKHVPHSANRIYLTPTGLLMEGVYTNYRPLPATVVAQALGLCTS